ncbi:TetR/AcrR family transcriptional regulator [Thalassospira lucentensis]|uniref:TetR/AcrR family transcriptional regulator n=1 Tax=Thalassospira lucentensis TaxID=168935 RepID=UPI0003B71E5E|nr:TetR/AcrR family transcriptional regulator [Thalassospira lucentensis]
MDQQPMFKTAARISLRERITQAAFELFEQNGINHVTLENIAVHAGTTRMGVYRHFTTKDDLVELWVTTWINSYRAVLDGLEADYPDDANAQLRGWIDYVVNSLTDISHRGCNFINTIAEIPDPEHPIRGAIETHKRTQSHRMLELCRKAGLAEPDLAAAEFNFLLEGAQVAVQIGSNDDVDKYVKRIAERILDNR